MQTKTSFNLSYAMLALLAILMLQAVFSQTVRIEQIPHSQFQTYLGEERVEEVRIGQNRIQAEVPPTKTVKGQRFS